MSEQTPRRRRADRVYTPEENEAAPCRRRMNADEPPRRRRTREYYSPEEFIPYPAADSFDTMPPDIPFDVPPDTPSAPRNGNSVCRRWANRCAGRCNCSVLRARISPSAVRMGSATC